jgi:hypothetical protein
MRHRLRIEIFFDADDSVDARSFVKSFLDDNEGVRHFGDKKISVHNVENRRGGHLPIHGPWENKDDS